MGPSTGLLERLAFSFLGVCTGGILILASLRTLGLAVITFSLLFGLLCYFAVKVQQAAALRESRLGPGPSEQQRENLRQLDTTRRRIS
jgi:hypothetical protein